MLKKWFANYKNKFRPEGMKNDILEFLLFFLIRFQTMHISENTIFIIV